MERIYFNSLPTPESPPKRGLFVFASWKGYSTEFKNSKRAGELLPLLEASLDIRPMLGNHDTSQILCIESLALPFPSWEGQGVGSFS